MPARSEFQERIDVLDLLINILSDHEETLSRLADRFETLYDEVSTFQEKFSTLDQSLERLSGLEVRNVIGATGLKGSLVTVKCKDWLAFRSSSQGALLVTFEVNDDQLMFSSVTDLFIFTYSDGLPEVSRLLDSGTRQRLGQAAGGRDHEKSTSIGLSLEDEESVYGRILDPNMVRRWLSSELGILGERVVEGRVLS